VLRVGALLLLEFTVALEREFDVAGVDADERLLALLLLLGAAERV